MHIDKYYKEHPKKKNKKPINKYRYWLNFAIKNIHWIIVLIFAFFTAPWGAGHWLESFGMSKNDAFDLGVYIGIAYIVLLAYLIYKLKNSR